MKRQFFKIVTFTAVSMCFLPLSSCKEDKKIVKPIVIDFKKEGELSILKTPNDSIIATLDIEIADTEYETQTGMMYRDSLRDDQGMLFIFKNAGYHAFYMKNTRIALDIIYIGADKRVVSIKKNAQPFDETSLPSNALTQYVLEINAGLADQWNIEVGDMIMYATK